MAHTTISVSLPPSLANALAKKVRSFEAEMSRSSYIRALVKADLALASPHHAKLLRRKSSRGSRKS